MRLHKFLDELSIAWKEIRPTVNFSRLAFVAVCGGFAAPIITDLIMAFSGTSRVTALSFALIIIALLNGRFEKLVVALCDDGIKTPEKLCRFWSFLLPKYCRERYLEPVLEEMKEDRIRAGVEAETDLQRRLIEGRFYVKLAVTYLFTLLCLLRDGVAKVSPLLKWFLTGTMR